MHFRAELAVLCVCALVVCCLSTLPHSSASFDSTFLTVGKDWSINIKTEETGFAISESPFRPFHHKPKVVFLSGRLTGFFCSSAFEVVGVDLETGTLLWQRLLGQPDEPSAYSNNCFLGYCSGVDIHIDYNSPSTSRCRVQVFAVSPDVRLFSLDATTGLDCQQPVQLFSQTPVFNDSSEEFSNIGVTIPPVVTKEAVVLAMDTARASNIRGGYVETRLPSNISIVILRRRFGSSFKAPMVYSEKLDLLYAVLSPSSSPRSSLSEERFSNSVIALRISDLAVVWSYKFLYYDEFIFDYRHPPLLVDIPDSNDRKIPSLFILTAFGNVYWLDAATGYERYQAFVRPLFGDDAYDEGSYNWIRTSKGTFGNIFVDAIQNDDALFSRFPNFAMEDGTIRMSPPGLLNGAMVTDSKCSKLYVSFVQSLFFLEPPSASEESKGRCSAASNHLSGCRKKPLDLAICPLSCESGFVDLQSLAENAGDMWCANVSETGITAMFLNGSGDVAWSFALNPFLNPLNILNSMPQLLNIRSYDLVSMPASSNLGESIWLIDPFTRSVLVANAEVGELEPIESEQFTDEQVIHWAKFFTFHSDTPISDSLQPTAIPDSFRDAVLLFSEGHSWTAVSRQRQTVQTTFHISLLRLSHYSPSPITNSAQPTDYTLDRPSSCLLTCTILTTSLLVTEKQSTFYFH